MSQDMGARPLAWQASAEQAWREVERLREENADLWEAIEGLKRILQCVVQIGGLRHDA